MEGDSFRGQTINKLVNLLRHGCGTLLTVDVHVCNRHFHCPPKWRAQPRPRDNKNVNHSHISGFLGDLLWRKACKYNICRGDVQSMDIHKSLLMQISQTLLRLVQIASLHSNPHAGVRDLAAKTPDIMVRSNHTFALVCVHWSLRASQLNHRYQEAIVLAQNNEAWTG